MFNAMIETLKANPRKIVFTEGHDARILEATDRLVKGGFLTPILIGNVDVVKANAAKGGYNIEGVEIIDPETYPEMDAMVDKMVELRKGKMTADECRKALSKGNYFGAMLVKMGYADSLARPILLPTPSVPLCRSSRPRRARIWCPPASFWCGATRSWPWATAPSTSAMRIPLTRKAT